VAEVRISAEPRTEFGKGGARRTRRAGKVPAVLYGHGAPPRHLCLPAREFAHALKTDAGANVLLRLDVDGTSELALAKAVQRDVVRGDIEHVDLLLVRRGEKVRVDVPVQVSGDVVPDGLVDQQLTTLAVEAEATNIPQSLEVSITGLQIGGAIHASDVQLPEGVQLQVDPDAIVVHILAAPTAAQIEAELAAEAPAAAEEAAPAAAAEAPAAPESGEGAPAES
jgi:large subunit ribosomal protein L25